MVTMIIAALLAASCAPPTAVAPDLAPGRYSRSIKVGELDRAYLLKVPRESTKGAIPLVIVLHGWGSNKEEAEQYTGFGAESDTGGFALAIPDGTAGLGKSKGWNTGFLNLGVGKADDVALIDQMIHAIEKDVRINPKMVYVVGHSNGAMMAYTAGARLSGEIAAIGVVAGTIGSAEKRVPSPSKPVSAIIIHGKADPMVPYDASSKALLKSIPAPESAKWWAAQIGCQGPTRTTKDDGNVLIDDFRGGRGGAEVEFATIVNGTHDWPGGLTRSGAETKTHVNAADLIWAFLKAHPKR